MPSSETKSTSGGGDGPLGLIIYPFEIGGNMRSIKIHAERSTSDIFLKEKITEQMSQLHLLALA